MLETEGWADYALIDSGNGEKLERYGRLHHRAAGGAGAVDAAPAGGGVGAGRRASFVGIGDEEADGRWRYRQPLGETWPMAWDGVPFLGRFTNFRHVGVFPEQATHWTWIRDRIAGGGRPVKVLNLFGYTGVASLVAARAGAEVTHIDASKKAIGWARENQALGGAGGAEDPLDLRGRGEVRRARGPARQPL